MFFKSPKPWIARFALILILLGGMLGVMPAQAAGTQLGSNSLEYVPLPLPTGWSEGKLLGLWGSSNSDVYAVGYVYDAGPENGIPLLYHNNGSGWTEASPALPAGWTEGYLLDVWGFNASDMYVVGSGVDAASNVLPLIYHNSGTSWTESALPVLAGLHHSSLHSVWGSSANDIYAVGFGYDMNMHQVPLLYHNDGAGWTESSPSLPTGGWNGRELISMWGSSANDVYAVGDGYNAGGNSMPLLYHYNGSSWTEAGLSLPAGLVNGYLSRVWGASANDVYAAGYTLDASWQSFPLLYHNDGSGWTETTLSLPAGWTGLLSSVSGSNVNDSYAVGTGYTGSTYMPLLYHNDGSGWTEANLSLPAGWIESHLHNVWDSNQGDVYTVGDGFDANGHEMPLLYQSHKTCISDLITVTNTNDSDIGSLRQAIADICPGGTINFDSSLAGQTIMLGTTLIIDKDLTIDATTLSSQIKINGSNSVTVFQVAPDVTVTMNSLTITNGNGVWGGGINNSGRLTLSNSILSSNSATNGGGITNFGKLIVLDSTISGNSATSDGGGVYNQSGILILTNSILSSNTAGYGGGIYTRDGIVTITKGILSSNSVTTDGGGIYNFGTMTVIDSTFFNNSAGDGGGIYHSYMGTVTITNSTFSENSVTGWGGGIYNDANLLEITNSTFAGNSAALGGGIFNFGNVINTAILTLTNSTFSKNSAIYTGSGIYNIGVLNFANSILANSTIGSDCYNNNGYSGTIGINVNNLVETNANAPHDCGSPLLISDPVLGSLQDNGGSTQTMALLPGSPAIDTGNDANCPSTDQRGVTRPQGAHCDIGSYEAEPPDITLPTVTSIVRADPSPTSAASVSFTVTFSEPVTGVDSKDFTLHITGKVTGATIGNVIGSGNTYTVTVNTGTGQGKLRLDVPVTVSITDLAGNPLGGLPFSNGETYRKVQHHK